MRGRLNVNSNIHVLQPTDLSDPQADEAVSGPNSRQQYGSAKKLTAMPCSFWMLSMDVILQKLSFL